MQRSREEMIAYLNEVRPDKQHVGEHMNDETLRKQVKLADQWVEQHINEDYALV
jgi:hypothetical protein